MTSSIKKLINKFRKLPGVGQKTAERYAFAVISMSDIEAEEFLNVIREVKDNVKFCIVCGNFTDVEVCDICSVRQSDIITVVAYPKDIAAIEKTHLRTAYHVLHGVLSPLDGKGPDNLRIKELLERLYGDVSEVILATNPDVEGEATAMYIAKLIKPQGIKVTRLAQGISMGSDIEYADEATLSRALETRVVL
ncbi:MAG: recombination mediator RecR [Firmicutes bacterium]|nr:recombination mediator RecR [Bacillota bacterium]